MVYRLYRHERREIVVQDTLRPAPLRWWARLLGRKPPPGTRVYVYHRAHLAGLYMSVEDAREAAWRMTPGLYEIVDGRGDVEELTVLGIVAA